MTDYQASKPGNKKFIIGGLIIITAIIYLVISASKAGAQPFITIDELMAQKADYLDRDVKITGAVIGDSIVYDKDTQVLSFTVAHVPADNVLLEEEGGLALALYNAVNDPERTRLDVKYDGVPPDLLRSEAQAIMTGTLLEDGSFQIYPNELLLKCPTKYEEAVPEQVVEE